MTEIIKNITIDVAQPNILDKVNYITAKQGDKGSRFVCAKLANESEEITVEPTSTVILNAYKPDGTRADKIGKVNPDGSVTVEITSQMLATEGQVDCDISIIDVKGTKLTTTTFYVQVQPAAIPDGSIVSSSEYSAISDLLLRVQAVDENEIARQEAEVERVEENKKVKTLINSFVGNMTIANTATPGAVKSGGDITVSSDGTVSILPALKRIYPVGTTQISMTNTNPSTYLGFGTWVQFAQGRTLVGVDTGDTDFKTSGKTGGKKAHQLTVEEIPSHIHKAYSRNWNAAERAIGNTADLGANYNTEIGGNNWGIQPTGGDQPHNNMQPYITVYFWQRTA